MPLATGSYHHEIEDQYPESRCETRVPPGMDSAEYIMSALRASLSIAKRPDLYWCDGCQGPSDQPTVLGLCPSCASGWESGGKAVQS